MIGMAPTKLKVKWDGETFRGQKEIKNKYEETII